MVRRLGNVIDMAGRYLTIPAIVDLQTGSAVSTTVRQWSPPKHRSTIDIAAEFTCPMCGFPLRIPIVAEDSYFTNVFSPRQIFSCSAHWLDIDEDGVVQSTSRIKCGWRGVFYGAVIHKPGCPQLISRKTLSVVTAECTCKNQVHDEEAQNQNGES